MIYQSYYDTYSGLTSMLLQVCRAHKNVSSANLGEVDDYTVTGQDTYPLCFVELPITAQFIQGTINWSIAMTVVSKTKHDRTDEQEKINECFNICNDIVEAVKDLPNAGFSAYTGTNGYWVDANSVNIMTLTRFKDDYNSGVRMEFTVIQDIPVNTCLLINSFNV